MLVIINFHMQIPLVMTIIGKDRPGIVEAVASIVVKHGGNWLESRMCRLGGEFAGILRVEIPSENEQSFINSLADFQKAGLTVITKRDEAATEEAPCALARLELIGNDRPGIIFNISAVLARHSVNVEELETECESAPMSGQTLFKARAKLKIPASCNISQLKNELEKISGDLMVDAVLQTE